MTLVNGGFEAGTLHGWSGQGQVVSNHAGYRAPFGGRFAIVGGGCPTRTLMQAFTADAGQVLRGASYFKAGDYLPYNDSGSVALQVVGSHSTTTLFSSSVSQVGNYGSTGWRYWSFTAPADGDYRIEVRSSNSGDCSATSYVGIDIDAGIVDTLAPAVVGVPDREAVDGWYRAPVTIDWQATDAAPSSGTPTDPADTIAATDGADVVYTSGESCDPAANCATGTLMLSIDQVAPTLTATVSPEPNAAGWHAGDVTISWSCADELSGVSSCPEDTVITDSGDDLSATGVASDVAGNTVTVEVGGIKIDRAPPTVAYSGQQTSYSLVDEVAITCAVADDLSGIASHTCADVAGPGWTFGAGTTTASAAATDNAGNVGAGSVSFDVVVDAQGLCALATEFSSKADVARALCSKLDAWSVSATRGNTKSAAGQLAAFRNHVRAQSGKALTQDEAELLLEFSTELG